MDFNGFPPGELKFTAIPDLFFAQLLPKIQDLAELKIILHLMWLRQRAAKQAVSLADLQTDETLINGLRALGKEPYQSLTEGLQKGVADKALLHVQVENKDGPHDVYLLNSEGGRIMLEKLQEGGAGVISVTEVDVVSSRPQRADIFVLYEDNIGLVTPIIADELKDAEATYPQEWIEDAFKIAVENNVRKWSYIRAILERMETEGRYHATGKQAPQEDTRKRWFTDEEFERFFES